MGSRLPLPKALVDELVGLTPAQRIEFAFDILDSLDDPAEETLIAAYGQERLAQYRRDPSSMVTWEDFRERLRSIPE